MQYNQDDLVMDFARRTKKNLEFIEEYVAQKGPNSEMEVYEVTQLINSLLGLLVFPQQDFYYDIPETPLEELVKDGWPEIRLRSGSLPQDNLRQLIRYLRNGIAHHRIEFTPKDGKTISGVFIGKVELQVDELKKLVYRFVELIEERINLRKGNQPRLF